jgi:hypothetical protein
VVFHPTRKGVHLGRKMTAYSDLTGTEVPEDQLGKLVVRSHPELSGPVFIEALPNEVSTLDRASMQVVTLEWQPPGEDEPKTFVLSVDNFNKLSRNGDMADVMAGAQPYRGRSSYSGEEINYASMEHAGRPHRGKVSPEEAAFVRDNLAAVNDRLSHEGHRLIDPTNREHKERYGF